MGDKTFSGWEEAHYHFILTDFEKLLFQHGLSRLLKDMSEESCASLLKEAQEINNACKKS